MADEGEGPKPGHLADSAPNDAASDEVERRYSLQGECFAGVYVSANKASYPLRGSLLDNWKRRAYSDPEDPKKDGSRILVGRG